MSLSSWMLAFVEDPSAARRIICSLRRWVPKRVRLPRAVSLVSLVGLLALLNVPSPAYPSPPTIERRAAEGGPRQGKEIAPTLQVDAWREVIRVARGNARITTLYRAPVQVRGATASAAGGGPLRNGDFADGLVGWTWSQSGGGSTPGQVSVENEQAVMLEGDSFLVTLQQSFIMPPGAQTLSFDLILNPGFDTSSVFIPDAFEAQLLDQSNLPVVPTWNPLATSFFNMQEDQSTNIGSGTTFIGGTVAVDVSAVPAGTLVTLFLDFICADFDTAGGVTLENVALIGACCLSSGTCLEPQSEENCIAQYGLFRADCTTPPLCEPYGGACCLVDGTCDENLTALACFDLRAIFYGDCTTCAQFNCQAHPPIPAVSTWGLVVMMLMLTVVGTCVLRRSTLEYKEE